MTNSIYGSGLNALAAAPLNGGRDREAYPGTWFEALAESWGQVMDNQAGRIEALSNNVGTMGNDNPSQIIELTAESLRMGFMANSSSTSIDSVGKALETMARKG